MLLPLPQSENPFLFLWHTAFISLTCPPLPSLHSLCRSLIQLKSNLNSCFYKHKQTDLIIMKSYSVPQLKSSKQTGGGGHQHSNLHRCFFLTAEWEFTLSKPEKMMQMESAFNISYEAWSCSGEQSGHWIHIHLFSVGHRVVMIFMISGIFWVVAISFSGQMCLRHWLNSSVSLKAKSLTCSTG